MTKQLNPSDRQHINIGNQSNDGTGDPIRVASEKANINFTQIFEVEGNQLSFSELRDYNVNGI